MRINDIMIKVSINTNNTIRTLKSFEFNALQSREESLWRQRETKRRLEDVGDERTLLVIVVIIGEVKSGESPERWVGRTDQMLFTLKHIIK